MRRLLAAIAVLSSIAPSAALADGQDTAELLRARQLHILSLRVSGKDLFFKTRDDTSNGLTFKSPQTFVATDEVIVGFESFNPFLQQVAVDTTSGPDPSVADLQKFADVLATFPKFAPMEMGKGGAPPADCPAYSAFHKELTTLSGALERAPTTPKKGDDLGEEEVTVALLKDHAEKAVGKRGVETAAAYFSAAATAFEKKLEQVQTQLKKVAAFAKQTETCPDVRVSTLATLFELTFEGENRAARIERSAKDIRKAATALTALATSAKWMNQGQFEVARLDPAGGLVLTTDIGVTQLEFAADPATGAIGTRPLSGSEPVKAKVRLRKYRFLIPEFSVGGVYADIDVPRYGTATREDGKLVVGVPKMEKQQFSAAAMLNLIFRTWRGEVAHPMLQVGVSTGKDAPSFLLGGGIRIAASKHLGLSFGVLFARVKDLQTLKPGDPIGGTAEIEKDLTPRFQRSPYIALQLNL
jgi:hypothetical protein